MVWRGFLLFMKRLSLYFCFAILCCLPAFCEPVEAANTAVPEAKAGASGYVLFIIPQYNFVDDEYTIPKVIISRAGYTVEVASASTKEVAQGTDIMKVRPNLTVEQINVDRYKAVVFVGGYLSKKFYENKSLMDKTREFKEKGKLICAIDNIPYYLALWGLLKDIKVTVHPSLAKDLKKMGVNYVEKDIVIDKNFITADIYKYSDAFANEIVEELKKR